MASFLNENALEKEVIERLISKGYEHINGLETVEKNFRSNQNEVVFSEVLYSAMVKLNKSIPTSVIKDAVKKIVNPESTSIINENIRFHKYLSDGITMTYRQGNEDITSRLLIIDFNKFSNNIFHVVDQLTISGSRFSRRPDVIIYINGLPVVVIELKNMTDEKATIETAYNQLETYKNDIPQLFYFNGINVISDGISTRVGTLTSTFDRYLTWKLVDIYEKLPNNASYQIEVLINGLLNPSMLVDYITQYATFPDDKKIMPAYHQYRAIKLGVEHVLTAKDGRGGVVWHTQGSGKSYTMTFFAAKLIQQEKLENPTIIVVTDRNDLDEQLFATFSKSIDILRQTPKQIEDKKELREALNTKGGGIYFTTMQKFTIIGNEERMPLLTDRSNVIIIADEAHRTQYGLDAKYSKDTDAYQFGYAKHIRDAFPNAVFVGFTGTPVDTIDRSTPAVFGDYIDQYTMTDSVIDGSTVKIYYESRIFRIGIDEEALKKTDEFYATRIEEGASEYNVDKSKKESSRMTEILSSDTRTNAIAEDFIQHFEERQKISFGKSMIVVSTRLQACKLFNSIIEKRPEWKGDSIDTGMIKVVMTGNRTDDEELREHNTTKIEREKLAKRMKDINDSLKIVIVVDMWLTGFDAPCVNTMYVDKYMKGHNLMQAIARVNRVFEGKSGGLVVDYIGMMSDLREALEQYSPQDKEQVSLDINAAIAKAKTLLTRLIKMFKSVNYENDFIKSPFKAISLCAEYIYKKTLDDENFKKDFMNDVAELSAAESIVRTSLTDEEKQLTAFFKAIRTALVKVSENPDHSVSAMNRDVNILLNQSLSKAEMIDIGELMGLGNSQIDLFDEEFLNTLMKTDKPNLAIELLKRLLDGEIRSFEKTNFIKSQEYSDMVKLTLNRYHNKELTHAEVLEEMRKMGEEMKNHKDFALSLGLSEKELAFYDAVTAFPDVKTAMEEKILMELVKELTEIIKRSATIDWSERAQTRARMRVEIRRLLKKYDYPPDKTEGAVEQVVKQAEKMAMGIIS